MFARMNAERKSIISNIVKIVYFMRGSLQYDEAFDRLTYIERESINEFLTQRLEAESKRTYPQY